MTADLMVRAVGALERGSLGLTPQAETGVTYASKIEKGETRIDWEMKANAVDAHIRGLSPFPGAWCEMELAGNKTRIKVLLSRLSEGTGSPATILDENLTIACGQGAVQLLRLQKAGGKVQSADEFLRGNRVEAVL
jgi:methionyl-tRNA formyltransferase